MSKILIVDDNAKDRAILKKYASFEGYDIDEANNGMDAVKKCENNYYDVILMDVMMPELDGFSAAKTIIDSKDIPVIFVTARNDEYDRIHGFEVGADDYVIKPFSPKELMMRINVVIKRHEKANSKNVVTDGHDVFKMDALEVDFTARTLKVDNREVAMAPKECALLFYLVKNRNIALPRDKILTEVWGFDYYGDERTLDTHIKQVRKALGRYRKCLVTMKGIGYKFNSAN
ncbi:MAG: response regulator transcription factor [Lachnospiraceae bacterium]|nr:response regulator transcription factor [Lachnospiraceae bacterium]MBO4461250.1 response regulator transcription factor [Lachnospiraceae bacterium]MBR4794941.1 response regulator transcription factor [Lachnospiraceae bacterium]MBR5788970.1 response regulator transcription factor [Lachnospiraceae bacterium]